MRPRLALLLALALACGPALGDADESSSITGDSSGGEPTGGADPLWRREPGGRGGLYGLEILTDGDLVVVGELAVEGVTRPWAARPSAGGDELWSVMLSELRSHSSGERHGWLRRIGPDGVDPGPTGLGVTEFSPRDLAVHPAGGAVIVGQLLPPDACPTPWLGRVAVE